MKQIKIGTCLNGQECLSVIPEIMGYGFETFSLTFWETIGTTNIKQLGQQVTQLLAPKGIEISSISVFGNPLMDDAKALDTIRSFETLIDNAHYFGTDLVTGFTGRVVDQPIDASLLKFKSVFGELAKRAESKGVRIAFENCDMGGNWRTGDWNIAHNPTAWEMMFHELPNSNIGLQWEPCHQMVSLIDPLPQLKEWMPKIFNIHGKDATIDWNVIKKHGVDGPHPFVWHRIPGFGDTNWTDLISILRMNDYQGTIDIEGYHDPVYRGELELMGQVHGLNYLKQCRGGDFVPNPKAWPNV